DDPAALAALSTITTLTHLLPERDPHPNLYEITLFVFGFLNDATVWPALLVRWELALLEELGFGLDLGQCAATGRSTSHRNQDAPSRLRLASLTATSFSFFPNFSLSNARLP